ncbi:MAG: carbohydrate porin [Planctomycetota bacterium]|jgi:porin
MKTSVFVTALLVPFAFIAEIHAQGNNSAAAPEMKPIPEVNQLSLRYDPAEVYQRAPGQRRMMLVTRQDQNASQMDEGQPADDEKQGDQQEGAAEDETDATETPEEKPEHDWSDKLTGDWGGVRSDLKDHGVQLDIRVIQYFQGVASGGSNTSFKYGGNLAISLTLDGHKAGLWEGFFVNVKAESQFGNSINADAGALSLPNTTMLYPLPGYRDMAITQAIFIQALSKNFALAVGKVHVIDFWSMVYPEQGGGVDGFMNLNIIASASPWLRYVNLGFNFGGALVLTDDEQIQAGIFAIDLNNNTTTTGIPETFNDGAGVLGWWKFFFEVDDKPANILLVAGGSTREYHSFDSHPTGFQRNEGILEELLRATQSKDDGVWSAGIYYEQILWHKPENEDQKLRFLTGWSLSNGDPSLGQWAGMASLEATGLLFNREKDKVGLGAYYSVLTDDLKKSLDRIGADLGDYWGAELYYNMEVTPWFHVTADLQVVQSNLQDDDVAVIAGLRGVIDF